MNKKTLRSEIKNRSSQLTTAYRVEASAEIARKVMQSPEFQKAQIIFTYIATPDEPDTTAIIEAAWQAGKQVCVPKCQSRHLMTAYRITSFDQLAPQGPYQLLEPVIGNLIRTVLVEAGSSHVETDHVPTVSSDVNLANMSIDASDIDSAIVPIDASDINLAIVPIDASDINSENVPIDASDIDSAIVPIDESDIDLAIVPCISASTDGRRLGHGAGYYDRYMAGRRMHRMCICFDALLDNRIPMDEYDLFMDTVLTENALYSTWAQLQVAELRHADLQELIKSEHFADEILPGICERYQKLLLSGSQRSVQALASGLLLASKLGVTKDAQLEENAAGKQTVKDGPAISISHSKNRTILAWCEQGPIGIDIEDLPDPYDAKKAQMRESLVKKHFPESYRRIYEAAGDRSEDKALAFTKLWTTLEAILKCMGSGFTYPYMQHQEEMNPEKWRLQQYRVDNEIITIARR